MATTKQNDPEDQNEYFSGMSKEERVLHVAAGASALTDTFADILQTLVDASSPDSDLNRAHVAVPAPLVSGVVEVMTELLITLEDHGIITRLGVEAFVQRKRIEMQDRARAEGKPEGWCESCQMVHDKDEPEDTLLNVAAATPMAAVIAGLMRAAQEVRMVQSNPVGTSDEVIPPGTPIH